MRVWQRLGQGLAKTREGLLGSIQRLLPGQRRLTSELSEELEATLLAADLGPAATSTLMDSLRESVRQSGEADLASVRAVLQTGIADRLRKAASSRPNLREADSPYVVLVVGINGVGKTTTIGKLAALFIRSGKRVLLVAADTFRAAAGEQLELWARRVGADVIKHRSGADPAAVAYDGLVAARARKVDVVLVDTGGRLHTKANLMDELRKIHRTLGKALPGAPHEVWLVLDATVGQNGLAQARQFNETLGVTGVILTKLDGTAKGGIVVAITDLGLSVRYVGVGEGIEDLQPFDPDAFAEALLGEQ